MATIYLVVTKQLSVIDIVLFRCVDQCPETDVSLGAHVVMEYLVLGTLSYLPPPVLGTPALDLLG